MDIAVSPVLTARASDPLAQATSRWNENESADVNSNSTRHLKSQSSRDLDGGAARREQLEAQGLCPCCGQQLYRLKPLTQCCLSRFFANPKQIVTLDHQLVKKIPLTVPLLVERGQCLVCAKLNKTPENSSMGTNAPASDDPINLFLHPLSHLPSMNEKTLRAALEEEQDQQESHPPVEFKSPFLLSRAFVPHVPFRTPMTANTSSSNIFSPRSGRESSTLDTIHNSNYHNNTSGPTLTRPPAPPLQCASPLPLQQLQSPLSARVSRASSQRALQLSPSHHQAGSRPQTHRSKSMSFMVPLEVTTGVVATPPHYPAVSPRKMYQRHVSTRVLTGGKAIYTGPLNERGERHGYGELIWSNGDVYKGNFEKNQRQGHGTLTFAATPASNNMTDSGEYCGNWDNNLMHGNGTRRYANGDVFSGEYVQGRREGEGRFFYSNGDLYWGQWKQNQMHGPGRYYYASGLRFEGTFVSSKRTGKGKLQKLDGTVEIFQYINDQRVGQGVRWSSDRSKAWRLWMPTSGARSGPTGNTNVRLERQKISTAQAVSMVYEIEVAAANHQEELDSTTTVQA